MQVQHPNDASALLIPWPKHRGGLSFNSWDPKGVLGYIGIMEQRMETTIMDHVGVIQGSFRGYIEGCIGFRVLRV